MSRIGFLRREANDQKNMCLVLLKGKEQKKAIKRIERQRFTLENEIKLGKAYSEKRIALLLSNARKDI